MHSNNTNLDQSKPFDTKRTINKFKKSIYFYLILFIILIIGQYVVNHNYQFYNRTVVKITYAKNSYSYTNTNEYGDNEKYFTQEITAKIMNGKQKGNTVHLENVYTSSNVYDNKYTKGDDIFITLKISKPNKLTGTITGFKQDKYIYLVLAFFLFFILLVSKKKGFFTILSLFINVLMVLIALDIYFKGTNILFTSMILVICFTILSLFIISGWNKKTLAAILSTLLSLAATMLLYRLTLKHTSGIDYASLEYLTMPNDVEDIFTSELLIGGLGAIMDIAITMASAISELVERNSQVLTKDLIRSARAIGNDIMGTMINVLLFTYLCGGIPFFILAMKNGIDIKNIIMMYMPYEIYRFLTGSIGIVLSIPTSILISTLLLRKGRKI